MFERFSAKSREVVVIAGEYADGYACIETAHLLLALQSVASIAQRVLDELGPPLGRRQEQVAALDLERGDSGPQRPMSESTKKTLELGLREALSLGHNTIEPEHLLLGLTRHHPDLLDISPVEIREAVIHVLSERPAPSDLIEWTPAMERACGIFLEAAEKALDLLDGEGIRLAALAAAVQDVETCAEGFAKALAGATLPARKREEETRGPEA